MTAAAKKDMAVGTPLAWENPLIPNKKLRALYVAMVELRLLTDQPASKSRRAIVVSGTLRGQEGCRVSTTLDLKRGDLTSEALGGVETAFLRGDKLASARSSELPEQLPPLKKTSERLYLAMGFALGLKFAGKHQLLVAYLTPDDLEPAEWKPILRFASDQTLPVLFVVLPKESKGSKQAGRLSLISSKCGVPGIPVDASDPVALYRVAQESMLRARAGGGPVLMECIQFQVVGRKTMPADPIETMRQFLVHRRIVDQAWLDAVETRSATSLKAAR